MDACNCVSRGGNSTAEEAIHYFFLILLYKYTSVVPIKVRNNIGNVNLLTTVNSAVAKCETELTITIANTYIKQYNNLEKYEYNKKL